MSDFATPPPSPTGAERPTPVPGSPVKKVLSALLLPLFFVIAFPLLFASALHQPSPHDLSLLVVGPDQVVAEITSGLDATKEFQATHTDVPAEARASVEERRADGAIQVTVDSSGVTPTFSVTTFVANGEGRSVAAAVEAVGQKIATQLGATAGADVVDVAPLAATDELGTTLFYLLTYTSLGAYLTIIVLMQVMPKARLSTRYVAAGITAVGAPLIVFGLSSIWVGDYGASFGTIAALLGVNALYVFTIGAAAILIEQFLGKAATFGIMLLIVFLNFPSSGGAGSAAMLPPFWQFMHEFYFGAGALESFRSLIYFDGFGLGRRLGQLAAWTLGLILLTVIVQLSRSVLRHRRELEALTVDRPVAPKHAEAPKSITRGEAVAR